LQLELTTTVKFYAKFESMQDDFYALRIWKTDWLNYLLDKIYIN